MKRRQLRWMAGFAASATGLCLALVAPMVNAVPAAAATPATVTPATVAPALVPALPNGNRAARSSQYAGYSENAFGALTLSSTITVPTVKCTNSSTWNTGARLLAVMDSQNPVTGNVEQGGGVDVGCAKITGLPTYMPLLCDPSLAGAPSFSSGCEDPGGMVAPGDKVEVSITATGGCNPTCLSVASTLTDSTEGWSVSASSGASSDFNIFIAAVGVAPLVDFGKVALSAVAVDGAGFNGQKANLVDLTGHTLARTGALTKGRTDFTVKWVRVQ